MAWSIQEVAKLSGVTSRTLRHYDQIGLLPPAWTADNGYRYYEESQLRRLQRILLLRELGLGLAAIEEVLAGQRDEFAALEVHREWLLAESDRLRTLADTVQHTIDTYREEKTMPAQEMFEGFDHTQYEEEAISRWGEERVKESNRRWQALTPAERSGKLAEAEAINEDLNALRVAGVQVNDDAVQAIVDRHYAAITFSWTPTAEAYIGLGEMYVADPRFTASYDGTPGPNGSPAPRQGLARYLADAMAIYAATRLA